MATKEDDFKQRFVAVLKDVHENGKNDPEAMFLIGSLAARLLDRAGHKSWGSYKASMTPQVYAQLLGDFEKQGNAFHKDGKKKHAYAVQMLAISLIAPTQKDPEVLAGDRLLDSMLDFLVASYRKAEDMEAAKPKH